VTQGNISDLDRRSGRVIRRLEQREAVVLRPGGVVQPDKAAAEVPQQGIGRCRAILRRAPSRPAACTQTAP
jgi:hypothetical protein